MNNCEARACCSPVKKKKRHHKPPSFYLCSLLSSKPLSCCALGYLRISSAWASEVRAFLAASSAQATAFHILHTVLPESITKLLLEAAPDLQSPISRSGRGHDSAHGSCTCGGSIHRDVYESILFPAVAFHYFPSLHLGSFGHSMQSA